MQTAAQAYLTRQSREAGKAQRFLVTILALAALIQCLVVDLSREVERGTYQYACHPTLVRQNKWRACRYGMGAELVDHYTHEPRSARRVVESLVDRLGGIAEELGCGGYLARARAMAGRPTGSERQVALSEETGDLAEVVRRMEFLSLPLNVKQGELFS